MYHKTREEEVVFIKRLLAEKETDCPKCKQGRLTHFHKKAKKSNTEWICPVCKEVYKTVDLLYGLPDC